MQREDHVRHREKGAISKPRAEALEETKPTDTLISDIYPPELQENKFWLLKPHSLWYFGMVALGN